MESIKQRFADPSNQVPVLTQRLSQLTRQMTPCCWSEFKTNFSNLLMQEPIGTWFLQTTACYGGVTSIQFDSAKGGTALAAAGVCLVESERPLSCIETVTPAYPNIRI